jgi:tRNA-splicing ligase RtcB
VLSSGKFPVKIYTEDIETEVQQQLHELSTLSFIHKHVAAMPDVHAGIGATIGSVIFLVPTLQRFSCSNAPALEPIS